MRSLCQLPVLVALTGCFMTADENLWKQHAVDGRPDARLADAPSLDAPRPDTPPDVPRDDASIDLTRSDSPPPDLGVLDLATPDSTPPDQGNPDASCKQMVLKVTADADDGEIDNASFLVNGEGGKIFMGYWSGPEATWGYFRFELDQALPAGAAITGASLELWGYDQQQWQAASFALEVMFENAADAPAVTKSGDAPSMVGGRPVTATKVRWPTAGGLSWKLSQYNASPDLKAMLQELVSSHGGLGKLAHLQLWIRGVQPKPAEVGTHNFLETGYAAHPHKLTITWCQP